jgi:erythromycin esterase-like protein
MMLIEAVRKSAIPLKGTAADYDSLLDMVGDARLVLLGEASHGTHEFYAARAEITKRLIADKGFTAVAVEADWPDAYRVNWYVQGTSSDGTSDEALSGLRHFPVWMWRNTVVCDFVDWLHAYNAALPTGVTKTGFYGLDLYSLHASIEAVLRYLDEVDPDAAEEARRRYACFEHFGKDPQEYGYAASFDADRSCEEAVVTQFRELQQRANDYARRDGKLIEDEIFYVEQNARLIKNAEAYYRTMFWGRVESWNLRDTHMADTLDALIAHLDRHGGAAKVVVWAHNSHLGDARATEMNTFGEVNLGQLVRERYGRAALLVGFSTYGGTVTAASDWGAPAERKQVRPGLSGSYEALFHAVGLPRFLLPLRAASDAASDLQQPRLQRAIGVIYRPETERMSHYFDVRLADQFDALIHFEQTRAVEPLERTTYWRMDEPPDTFPSGI